MPSATFAEPIPSSHDESSEVGSLEHLKSSDAFPKHRAQRVASNGELQEPCTSTDSNSSHSSGLGESSHNGVGKSNSAPVVTVVQNGGPLAAFEPPFPLLPGEFVKHFGQISAGTQLTLTNFRLFVLMEAQGFYNIPLPSIDGVEARDMFYLVISCKDGRIVKIIADTSESCLMWYKLLTTVASGASKREEIFAFAFHAWCIDEKRQMSLGLRLLDAYLPSTLEPSELKQDSAPLIAEFKRLDFSDSVWRISDKNSNFNVCDTYPRFMIVPAWMTDSELERCAKYRFLNRMPAVVWRDKKKGSILLRSSQPNLGFFGWRCPEDEVYIQALLLASSRPPGPGPSHHQQAQANGHCGTGGEPQNLLVNAKPMLILDARSYAAAWANRAKGGGFESPEYYQKCEIQFMGLANIHAIRSSFTQLRTLLNSEGIDQSTWLQTLQTSQWLAHLSSLFSAAVQVVEALHTCGRSVLVHCSDGWDRTTQIISLAKLILDPYYRTLRGFRDLVEREWVEFGHKFADRCGVLNKNTTERSPVFLQWLDCVYQLYSQFPGAFEFNQAYLVKLAHHAYSGLFGTFLCNSPQEASAQRVPLRTFSVWNYLHPDNIQFRNVVFEAEDRVLWPEFQLKDLRLWKEVYCMSDPVGLPRPRSGSLQGLGGGNMDRSLTRAHSCDSLTSIGGTNGSEGQLVRTGSDSNLNNSAANAIQPPQYPASLCNGVERASSEEVCKVLDRMLTRVSESDSHEDPITPRATSETRTDDSEPASFEAVHHRQNSEVSTETDLCDAINGVAVSTTEKFISTESESSIFPEGDDISFIVQSAMNDGSRVTSDYISNISTSTTEISDPGVMPGHLVNFELAVDEGNPGADQPRIHRRDIRRQTPNGVVRSSSNGYWPNSGANGITKIGGGNTEEKRTGRKRWRKRKGVADWLDSDGLNTFVDVQQERMREMQSSYMKLYEKMESEMQRMRLMLRQQQNGYAIHRCSNGINVPGKIEAKTDKLEPGSLDSAGHLSDMSWENVDDGEAQPTKWIPDHAASHCMGCDAEFWTINRKHHCRSCGKVFCSLCSGFECPVPSEQLFHPVRVCNTCYNILKAEETKEELNASFGEKMGNNDAVTVENQDRFSVG